MSLQGKDIKIFAGNSNRQVAEMIADNLKLKVGLSSAEKFSDGEISVSIKESVRGSDCFVVQSTCSPVNTNMMELLIMIDALKRASAGRITAVIPYFGYARQDRKTKARDPISSKLCANIITTAGANRVLTMDLHAPQIQGFFDIPVDHLNGVPILVPYFEKLFKSKDSVVVVSPDLGSVTRARSMASKLDAPLAIIDKRRPVANVSEVMNIIGDVKGKTALIVDDMIDTAGTLCNAAEAVIKTGGAKTVYACATHGVLSGPAIDKINASVIEKLVLLDTIPLSRDKKTDKIETLSVAPVFGEAISRIYKNEPVSPLFD